MAFTFSPNINNISRDQEQMCSVQFQYVIILLDLLTVYSKAKLESNDEKVSCLRPL